LLLIFTDGDLFTLLNLLREAGQLDMALDEFGHTAVHWAASLGRMRILECLMAEGADLLKPNERGELPLMRAVAVNNTCDNHTFPELLMLLSDNVYAVDHKRHTILHHLAYLAGRPGREKPVRYYLDCLAEHLACENKYKAALFVNAKDLTGDTALHVACRSGDVPAIDTLLSMGAQRTVKNLARKIPEECILPGNEAALKCFYPESCSEDVCFLSICII
jgi:regulatory protein SWI6